MIDLEKVFEKYEEEYIEFDRIADPLNDRPDICAFLLLDRLVPGKGRDMVSGASHDEIYLDVDCEELSNVATEEDIITLIRCGVIYSEDGLKMFA